MTVNDAQSLLHTKFILNDVKPVKLEGFVQDVTEDKETDKVSQSNKKIDNILSSITDGFFAVDKHFTVTYWNRAAGNFFGITEEKVIGNHLWDFYPESDNAVFTNEVQKSFVTGSSSSFEAYYSAYDTWLATSVYPASDGLSFFFKDITGQKRLEAFFLLEKEVLHLNASLKISIEEATDRLLLGLQEIYPGMLCGTTQMIDGKLQNWCSPSLPVAFTAMLKGIPVGLKEGSCGTAAFLKQPVIVGDISKNPVWEKYLSIAALYNLHACWSFPLLENNHKVLGTLNVYHNNVKEPTLPELQLLERAANLLVSVIESKRAAKEMFISNERSKLLAKATNDTVWDWDILSDRLLWNEGIRTVFGYEKKQLGLTCDWWKARLHPDDAERVIKRVRHFIDTGKKNWSDKYRFLCADGTYKYVFDRGFLLLDKATAKPLRMIGAMQDITVHNAHELELKKLNKALELRAEELADTNAELERFAYVASHDLQEPLRMVSSFLQLLQKKYHDKIDSTANNYIHYAVDGAERMKRLIADMLQYSRINTNKIPAELVNMDDIVKEVIGFFANKIRLNNATVNVNAALPVITAVKHQMEQLLQSLLSNALKYKGAASPEIYISYIEKEAEWEFAIEDNGIGIDDRYTQKIFVIFQRLHNKTEYSGTGIGLAICKKIVEKHKGKIWVVSTPLKGSTFYFTIAKNLVYNIQA